MNVDVHQVSLSLSGRCLLENISLSFGSSMTYGILGLNGVGKTTFMRALCGLLQPTTGSIILDGRPLNTLRHRERALLISWVPQSELPAFSLPCYEVIMLGRFARHGGCPTKHDREVVERIIDYFDLHSFIDRDVRQLSSGERQRIMLARAMASENPILVMDEPTAHLDWHHSIRFFSLLKHLHTLQENLLIILSTHDPRLCRRYCDMAIGLSNKQVLFQGCSSQVLNASSLKALYQLDDEESAILLGDFCSL